jgi:hypothetical protein
VALRCQRDDRERRRPSLKRIVLIVVGVVLFIAISAGLARFFSVEGTERDEQATLLRAQARGDVNAMLNELSGCRQRPACVATVRANASRLRGVGEPKILSLKSPTAYSLTGASGETRLAWTVIGKLPVVQCVDVRRTGNPLTGIKIELRSLSPPIRSSADC